MSTISTSYQALHNGAAYFVLPPRHVSVFSGAKTAAALNGLVTNDVLKLEVGAGLYAVALAPKGKLLADVAILRTQPETFVVETSAPAGAEWWGMVNKYVNPRLAQFRDESANWAEIGVYGPNAAAIVAEIGAYAPGATATVAHIRAGANVAVSPGTSVAEAIDGWSDWSHAAWPLPTGEALLIRAPHLGALPGFVLAVPPEFTSAVRDGLELAGATLGDTELWDLAQLESSRPVFGLDMDATTIPQEANLDTWNAISFDKGCYTGQETVARIHFRGHVNRHLRGLSSVHRLPVGSEIHDTTGKTVGDVRRSGVSPALWGNCHSHVAPRGG